MRLLEAFSDVSSFTAVARAAHMTSCAALASVFVFERVIVRRCGAVPRRAWVIWLSLVTLVISGAAWLAAVTIDMTGLPISEALTRENLRLVLTQCDFGKLWLIRICVVVLTTIAWFILRALRRGNKADALLAGSIALLGSLAWAGHGSFGSKPNLHLTADTIHLLIIALWPGGLLPLWLVLVNGMEINRLTAIVNRFSNFALLAVAILVGSGWINTWMIIASWRGLIDTPYGQTLLVKLALLLGMLLLGAANLLYLRPRITTKESAMRRLRWNVAIETALLLGLMLVVGYLGLLPPPAEL